MLDQEHLGSSFKGKKEEWLRFWTCNWNLV